MASEKYGHTKLLRLGVGPITALAYVLTLQDPERFSQSRDVGPYVGLVPKQQDSGESQPQLGISKAGDRMLRKLLVGSAQYILSPFGPDTDLRRYGLRLCERSLVLEFCRETFFVDEFPFVCHSGFLPQNGVELASGGAISR